MAMQRYEVEKLAPYVLTETVFTPRKDKEGKHLGWDRTEKERKVTEGYMVYIPSRLKPRASIRVEGADGLARLGPRTVRVDADNAPIPLDSTDSE